MKKNNTPIFYSLMLSSVSGKDNFDLLNNSSEEYEDICAQIRIIVPKHLLDGITSSRKTGHIVPSINVYNNLEVGDFIRFSFNNEEVKTVIKKRVKYSNLRNALSEIGDLEKLCQTAEEIRSDICGLFEDVASVILFEFELEYEIEIDL